MSESTFCPQKAATHGESHSLSDYREKFIMNPDIQTFSAINGLDLLSNIAFLTGIIDSPTPFIHPAPKDEDDQESQTQGDQSEHSLATDNELPQSCDSSEDNREESDDDCQNDVESEGSQTVTSFRSKTEDPYFKTDSDSSATSSQSIVPSPHYQIPVTKLKEDVFSQILNNSQSSNSVDHSKTVESNQQTFTSSRVTDHERRVNSNQHKFTSASAADEEKIVNSNQQTFTSSRVADHSRTVNSNQQIFSSSSVANHERRVKSNQETSADDHERRINSNQQKFTSTSAADNERRINSDQQSFFSSSVVDNERRVVSNQQNFANHEGRMDTNQQIFTSSAVTSNHIPPITNNTFDALPSHHLLRQTQSNERYRHLVHSGLETNPRFPFPLYSNFPNMGQNVVQFPFPGMSYVPARGQTSERNERNGSQDHQMFPWMLPTCYSQPPPPPHHLHSVTKQSFPPNSVHNWLADNTPQFKDLPHKANNHSLGLPYSVTASEDLPIRPPSMASLDLPAKPVVFRTAPATTSSYTSSSAAATVISHLNESRGKDEKVMPVPGLSFVPEWLSKNVYQSHIYQPTPVRAYNRLDSPPPELDPDSAFCSPGSCDDGSLERDMTPDRSTPSSGIQSGSTSLQNLSPVSTSDNSNLSSSSDSCPTQTPSHVASETSSRRQLVHGLPPPQVSAHSLEQTYVNQQPSTADSQTRGQAHTSVPESSRACVTSPETTDQGKKKSRTNYTPEQVRSMERIFMENPYPESDVMEELSKTLNIPEQKLKVWFQNKRARWRKRVQENKIPAIHPLFVTPQTTYGMMRPPTIPAPFFPFPGNLNIAPPRQLIPNYSPGLPTPRPVNPYTLQKF